MNIEDRIEAVVAAVFAAFKEGKVDGIPVKEIAERIGCTAPQVNSAVNRMFYGKGSERGEGWSRIVPTDCYVDVHERNFGSVTHQRKCTGYMITREYMRKIITGEVTP